MTETDLQPLLARSEDGLHQFRLNETNTNTSRQNWPRLLAELLAGLAW
jgi:hypothetical protein